MKANELRIGNWVSYRGERNMRVYSLGYEFGTEVNGIRTGSQDISDYRPIVLTPEILESAGFSCNDEDGIIWYTKDKILLWERYGLDVYYILHEFPKVELEYLHQLQNLYFALTGQELEIEL